MKTLSIDLIKLELKKKVPKFARDIQPSYRELDFKWGKFLPKENDSVPTVKEIEDTLYELIESVEEIDLSLPHPYMARASGGLCVGYQIEKDDDDFITSIEIFINFSYDDTSYADIKSYLQEWE